tara:strand:- start:5931 stop:6494 length:564 start_codon:yes stop_codon:yes gene_type:complete
LITDDINTIVKALKNGDVILYPTDTIWGLGCDATNKEAVERLLSIKKRGNSKSQVCLVSDDAMLNRTVKDVPEIAWELIDETDKPLTLVLPNAQGLADNVTADDNSVGLRMIKAGTLHRVVYNFRKPIVSTSANISGESSPTSFESISEEIKDQVDLIANLDTSHMTSKASSIIKVEMNGEITILRK